MILVLSVNTKSVVLKYLSQSLSQQKCQSYIMSHNRRETTLAINH